MLKLVNTDGYALSWALCAVCGGLALSWWRSRRSKPPSMSGLQEQITLPHDQPIELYHNILSGCSGKVRVCLAEKGVKYKSNHIHLIETGWYQTCSPEFKKINPAATVPVLVHHGHPVYESHAQIQYVDKEFKGPGLSPPELQDQINQWVDFTSLKCTHGFSKHRACFRIH